MKYSVIDLFCGCGGLSEGFKLAGFNVIGGIDFNQKAIETYQKNFKNSKAICTDLLNFSEDDIKSCFLNLNQVDVAIVEDFLTFIVYGQGYFIDNIFYQTQTGIQIRPYDSKRDFIFLNISKDIVL